jgi:hypothetical protein
MELMISLPGGKEGWYIKIRKTEKGEGDRPRRWHRSFKSEIGQGLSKERRSGSRYIPLILLIVLAICIFGG